MTINQLRVCVVTGPRPKAGIVPLSNLVDVLCNLCGSLYIITGNEGDAVYKRHENIHGYSITYKPSTLLPPRIVDHIALELKICYKLVKLSGKVDLFIFFMGEGLLLPVLVGKLVRKSVILSLAASLLKIIQSNNSFLSKPFQFFELLNYALSDGIIVASPSLIKDWHLEKYRDKISVAHQHFLDFNKFNIQKRLAERDNTVGYIGRFSEEKGTLNFVRAIPEILKEQRKINFLVAGDGQLRGIVEEYLDSNNLHNKVRFVGWIPHDELPDCLNRLKLLVFPSYTEGLPNMILEAMACGTPVLATPVGAIPDVIRDGETGFILEDSSPQCIARNTIRALNYPDLDQITTNARGLVQKEYTYEEATRSYRSILMTLRPK